MTTSCDRWRDPIAEVAAGEPVSRDLETHLDACGACQQALLDARALHARIDRELRQALSLAPSPNLLPLVREQVARGRSFSIRLLLPVAAVLALLVLSITQWRRPEPAPAVPGVDARRASPTLAAAPSLASSDVPRPQASLEPAVARRPDSRAVARRDVAKLADPPLMPIPDAEPVRPAALVIAPLDAPPPIETRPLVTVGLDSEGAER